MKVMNRKNLAGIMMATLLVGCTIEDVVRPTEHIDSEQCEDQIVSHITEFMERYSLKAGMRQERDDECIYIRGTMGMFPAVFDSHNMVVCIYPQTEEVVCFGYLPTKVLDDRREEMVEFLFRADCEYGLSPATLVLDDDGNIRCQSWLPFRCFNDKPEMAAKWLVGSVMDKLYACSLGVAEVETGGTGKDSAIGIEPAEFMWSCKAEVQSDKQKDVNVVLETCFSDNEWNISKCSGEWPASLCCKDGDDDVDFINASISGFQEFYGGAYDELHYTLVVKNGFVWNLCALPVDIPLSRLRELAKYAMSKNAGLKGLSFGIDFKNRKLWCQYGLPVCTLGKCKGREKPNILEAYIKTRAPSFISKSAQELQHILGAPYSGAGGASAEMIYAALDGSGELSGIAKTAELAECEREWMECENGNAFTNSAGDRISLMEYCRLANSVGAHEADSWLTNNAKRCDTGCEVSTNSRIVYKYLSTFSEPENFEEELERYSLWHLGEDLYVVKTEEASGQMGMHMYGFVMYDVDNDDFKVLLPFDYLPQDERIIASLRQARTNPAAINNIAAMAYNNVAWRQSISDEYIVSLLEIAANAGEPTACRNLAIYFGDRFLDDSEKDAKRKMWLDKAFSGAKAVQNGKQPNLKPLSISQWPKTF